MDARVHVSIAIAGAIIVLAMVSVLYVQERALSNVSRAVTLPKMSGIPPLPSKVQGRLNDERVWFTAPAREATR